MANRLAESPILEGQWMDEIARLVNEITGVKLGARQSAMLETRLQKRMAQLGCRTSAEYLEFVRNNLQSEVAKLVALLTTHHTFFFRESVHFQYLEQRGLPTLVARLREKGEQRLKVWSAACSQGQEVYSLAMFLAHHLKHLAAEIKIDILGSDVDPESIAKARNGVYRWQDLKQVPLTYLYNHWVRGTAEISEFAKAKSSIKTLCRFEESNLVELAQQPVREKFDIIFCRNVFIYFEPDLIKKVSEGLIQRLNPDGLLFLGLSESLISTGLPVLSLAPSVYAHKTSVHGDQAPASLGVASAAGNLPGAGAKRHKVFCVDDSPTILSLLKQILEPEFEIIGTATNGNEAAQALKTLRPDLVTLDIHMPEQGGIEYLEKNFSPVHPPVIILSSVPREDSNQAMRCLELGARDYIEKPELADLELRADEIRTKIRCAIQNADTFTPGVSDLERSFHQPIQIASPERKIRLICSGAAERAKLAYILRECNGIQPPTVILMEGSGGLLPSLARSLSEFSKLKCHSLDAVAPHFENGSVYLGDFQAQIDEIIRRAAGRKVSLLLLGAPTDTVVRAIGRFSPCEVILEDNGAEIGTSTRGQFRPAYFVPYTSMAYHSNKYLSQDHHEPTAVVLPLKKK